VALYSAQGAQRLNNQQPPEPESPHTTAGNEVPIGGDRARHPSSRPRGLRGRPLPLDASSTEQAQGVLVVTSGDDFAIVSARAGRHQNRVKTCQPHGTRFTACLAAPA
jgi:hypothetical protein